MVVSQQTVEEELCQSEEKFIQVRQKWLKQKRKTWCTHFLYPYEGIGCRVLYETPCQGRLAFLGLLI